MYDVNLFHKAFFFNFETNSLNTHQNTCYIMRTTSPVSEIGDNKSYIHSVVIRKIGSHSVKYTVSKRKK